MKRTTLFLLAGLLFTAAALKLSFPKKSTQVIYTLKDTVTTYSPEETIRESSLDQSDPYTVTINAADYLSDTTVTAARAELPQAVEEAVETFLSTQQPFETLGIPANVSYDVEIPSFPIVKPVSAATSSGFGYRVHPLENLTKFHFGTDLAAQSGDDILSFASGTVSEVGEDEAYGKYIRITHDDGYESMYAHCGTIFVAAGQNVCAGEKIALVGSTGRVTGPHLHFELTRNGTFLNPEFLFAAI